MDQDRDGLLRRVECLERENRWWKRISVALAALWILVGGPGRAVAQRVLNGRALRADDVSAIDLVVSRNFTAIGPARFEDKIEAETIYAKSIVIRDANGNTTARLGGFGDGDRSLAFYGKQGGRSPRPQVELAASDDGAWLSFRSPNGSAVSLLSGDDLSGLSVKDEHGKSRLEASVAGADINGVSAGVIKLVGSDGNNLASMSQDEEGASLHLYGQEGDASLNTWGGIHPAPGLELRTKQPSQSVTLGFVTDELSSGVAGARRPDLSALDSTSQNLWQIPVRASKRKH